MMSKKRSFIELINRKAGAGAEYLPKTEAQSEPVLQESNLSALVESPTTDRVEDRSAADPASQDRPILANQPVESWQAIGKPESDWQATIGKPNEAMASQDQADLASQSLIEMASQVQSKPASQIKNSSRLLRGGRIAMTVRYAPEIYRDIKDFCEKNGVDVQNFCEMAACHYLDSIARQKSIEMASQNAQQVASRQAKKVASWQAHDDLMIFKVHDDIIMLFKQMTGRKWTASDDRVAAPFNNIDRRLVEIGMINTVIQARGRRINSFAYFVPEIQTMIDLHVDNQNLDAYLRRRRELLAKYKGQEKSKAKE
jgi:hypothetical protein